MDTLDLYSAKHRAAYIKQAAYELGLDEDRIKKDLGLVLLKLEALQDQLIQKTLTSEQTGPSMSDAEIKAALRLLKDPKLIERILADFNHAGIVGEETNKLVGYLAACSRKLDKPLAVLIQSTSAAGKTSLMDAILSFMPDDQCIQYSAMTGQSLFYMGETDLKHKVLAIAEEEGAHNTSYALKLLQSEGEVTIASTGKNATTGNLETQQYRVEGPVALFSTTTAIDIDEELLNRCIVLTVDETRAQTQAIHAMQRQRRTLQGLQNKLQQDQAMQTHRHAQQLLKPLKIINPYADRLTFLDDKTRTRRDHEKYLSLIDTIALLHQYQRPIKKLHHDNQTIEYIEVALNDIQLANQLAHEVLGRTLDELPPQTRKLLHLIHAHVQAECNNQHLLQSDYRFSRKTIREHTGWSDGQLKIHCRRLEDMEYVLVHGGGRGRPMQYELLYDGAGREGYAHLMGLIDVERLQSNYDAQKLGPKQAKSPPSQAQVSTKTGASQSEKNNENTANKAKNETPPQKSNHQATQRKSNSASHPSAIIPLAALSR